MAGGINVGSVLVDVLPDARGWDERLTAQITPAAEAVGKKISKELEDDIADGARKGAEKAKVDLASIGDADVKVKVKVDEDASAADVKRSALRMGTEFGTDFSNATSEQTSHMSPLIMAAVAGGDPRPRPGDGQAAQRRVRLGPAGPAVVRQRGACDPGRH
jgi:hypothetical protein